MLTVIESNANQCNLIKSSLAKSFCYERAEDYNLALKSLIQAKSKVLNLAISMIFMRLN